MNKFIYIFRLFAFFEDEKISQEKTLRPNDFVVLVSRLPTSNRVQCLGSRLISSREEGRDVTAEYVDSSARLETLRVSKKQLAALMERATSVADVLSVRSELDRVIGLSL